MTGRSTRPDRSTLSRRVRGVLSPSRERGRGALRPDSSTLSRRVRGVLSPCRERGNSGLAPRRGRWDARMDSGLRRNDGKGGGNDGTLARSRPPGDMTALRCVIDMTIRLGGAKCKRALSYWGRWGGGSLSGEAFGDGAAPRLPPFPRGRVIPAKAGTYWEDRLPTRKREPTRSPDYGYEIPAYAGMTVMGTRAPEWIPAYAGMTVIGGAGAPEWIPAYAGMTVGWGMTGRLCAPSAVPSPAAFAASSPLIGRGGIIGRGGNVGACAPLGSRCAGMTVIGASPLSQAGRRRGGHSRRWGRS